MLVAKEGLPFIFAPVVLGAFLIYLGGGWVIPGAVFVALALFCAFFFRDPERNIPEDKKFVIGPADGVVMEVTKENGVNVIRIFLSVFNVHIQRAPVSGTITKMEYRPGKFLPAMKPEAHSVNEQNVITIRSEYGDFVVKQIAGILARRVVSWVQPQDSVIKGSRIGLIKFASQVDLYVPDAVEIMVKPGDRITAGVTIMGEIKC